MSTSAQVGLSNDWAELGGFSGLDSSRWIMLGFLFFALLVGFFAVDHSPSASTHYRFDAEFIDSDNRTANRVEAINLITAPVRIVLALSLIHI